MLESGEQIDHLQVDLLVPKTIPAKVRENLVQTCDICICLAILVFQKQQYFFGELRNQKSKALKAFTRDRRPHQSNRKSLTFLFAWFVIPRTISQICPHAIEANVNRFLRIFQAVILFVLTRDALFPLSDVVFMKGFLESHQSMCLEPWHLGALQVSETCRWTLLPVWCKYHISLRHNMSGIKEPKVE